MILIAVSILFLVGIVIFVTSTDNLSQFGANPKGERLERIKKSAQYNGEKFVNKLPVNMSFGIKGFSEMLSKSLFGKEVTFPKKTIPIIQLDTSSFRNNPSNELRATWMGHSTVLIEIEGAIILIDPVWSKRCSPSSLVGPKRFHPPPISIEELPPLDAVLISHDHYDHLDKNAVCKLAKTGVRFYIPLGVGAHLEKWGISLNQISEMDWWDGYTISEEKIEIIATPARHFSGRGMLMGSNPTLWVSWVIAGKNNRVFHSGDTGIFPGIKEVGDKFGPFDVTFIKIGAYNKMWPDIHLNPEQAIDVQDSLGGKLLIPIHWGTFNLAFHDWFEPAERLADASNSMRMRLFVPRPGQIISISNLPEVDYWWRELK
ncbi:MAG: hydrolase [candidate division Zixibacteria bacterium]|nr:hydrolase [candidate division Zixibacteria bacterium]